MTGHLVRLTFDAWEILEHPKGCDPETCEVGGKMESRRLPNGQMQVQGVYHEGPNGGWTRMGAA